MTTPYSGNAAVYPANVSLIDDGDAPSGVLFSSPLQQLADRTAVLSPDVQTFASNGTWTKPALAKSIEITLVGAGGSGSAGSGGTAGSGGQAGKVVRVHLPGASVPASLAVTVGAGNSQLSDGGTFVMIARAGQNGAGSAGGTGTLSGTAGAESVGGGSRGAGGTGGSGTGGQPGLGLGAGGGGGGSGGGAGTSAGGGGGDGGYGTASMGGGAAAGGNGGATPGTGGAGNVGFVIITTWRGQ